MKTKAINQLTSALLAMFAIILFAFSACSSDDPDPDPNPDPNPIGNAIEVAISDEEFEVFAYRLTLTNLLCTASNDSGYSGDGYQQEIYGYITASAEYEPGYINTSDNLETDEKTVLFYRNRDHWIGLKPDEAKPKDNSFTFYFNKNHLGKAKIRLGGKLMEKDSETDDDHFTINDTGYDYQINDIDDVEDIKLGTEYFLEFKFTDNDKVRAIFKFEKIAINSDELTYPEGKNPEDNFDLSSGDYPPPSPASYTSSIPASKKYVIIQKPPKKLYPQPNKLEDKYVYNINPKFVSDSKLVPSVPFEFNPGANIHSEYECLVTIDEVGETASHEDTTLNGLAMSTMPRYQLIEYWRPIKVFRVPAGVSKSATIKTHFGVKTDYSIGIETTFGFSAGMEGLGEFSSEITLNSSYSISTNSWDEYVDTTTITPDKGKNVVFVAWQRVNEIRLIGNDGEIFQDPNYIFYSPKTTRLTSNEIINEAYQFDANVN